MICCGKEITSRFCPDCGKPTGYQEPLASLLKHCRAMEKGQGSLARCQDRAANQEGRSDEKRAIAKERAESRTGHAMKWGAWADALQELLDRQTGNGG